MKQLPCVTISSSSFHVKNRNMTNIGYYPHYSQGSDNEHDKKSQRAMRWHVLMAKGEFWQFLQQRLHETPLSYGVTRHLYFCFTLCDKHGALPDKTHFAWLPRYNKTMAIGALTQGNNMLLPTVCQRGFPHGCCFQEGPL